MPLRPNTASPSSSCHTVPMILPTDGVIAYVRHGTVVALEKQELNTLQECSVVSVCPFKRTADDLPFTFCHQESRRSPTCAHCYAPTARTYHIDFQGSLTPSTPPAPTPATAFTPVSLVMVRPCGQYHGCGSYHGEIVCNTAWRPVAALEGEAVSVLEFTEHPPWPIKSSTPDRKWTP